MNEEIKIFAKKSIDLKDIINNNGWGINDYIEMEPTEHDVECLLYLQAKWKKFEDLAKIEKSPIIEIDEQIIKNDSLSPKTGGILHYRINEVKNLKLLNSDKENSEIYCESWLSGTKPDKKYSKSIKNTPNPEWTEEYLIQIPIDDFQRELWINIWNKEPDGNIYVYLS
jgi:C2 domain